MLIRDKILILKDCLLDVNGNYADSFKKDILFYFDEFNDIIDNDIKFNFLINLCSREEINEFVNNLTSNIVMNYNDEEIGLSDFIYYATN